MIGRLAGTVATTASDHVLIDVMGIGFVVLVSVKTLAMMPALGEPTVLWIETVIGNDNVRLYGFLSTDERSLFRQLTAIQGIGGKAALSVLGVLGADGLRQAVAAQDKTAISRVPGIGPKTATRLLTELQGKHMTTGNSGISTGTVPATASLMIGVQADVLSALINLGYNSNEAQRAVDKALQQEPAGELSTLIRLALREASST